MNFITWLNENFAGQNYNRAMQNNFYKPYAQQPNGRGLDFGPEQFQLDRKKQLQQNAEEWKQLSPEEQAQREASFLLRQKQQTQQGPQSSTGIDYSKTPQPQQPQQVHLGQGQTGNFRQAMFNRGRGGVGH